MNKLLLVALAAVLISAPVELSARQVIKHHTAKAQTRQATPRSANPNCALGATPPSGTQCGISDLSLRPGGVLQDTDTMRLCPDAAGCFGGEATYQDAQAPLGSLWTPYFRSKFTGTPPISYNASTGAFGCSAAASGTAGCVTPSGGTSNFLRADGTWAVPPGTGGTGGTTTVWTGTVTGTNTYLATPGSGQTAFANTAYSVFCGVFTGTSASTGASTLNVGSAGALPIDVQYGQTATAAAGAGDIPGNGTSLCLQINAAGNAWIKQTQVPGGIVNNPVGHIVTAFEWSTGYLFVCSQSAACSLTMPSAATVSTQGSITISDIAYPTTITPNALDGIDGYPINTSQDVTPYTTAVITTSGANSTTAWLGPLGELKRYPFSWGPGMNLATSPIPLVNSRLYQTNVSGITCVPGVPVSGTATIQVYSAPEGTLSTAVATSGTPIGSTCNAAGTSGTTQPLVPASVRISANTILWAVGTGAGWGSGSTSSSGLLQVNLQP